MPLQGDVALNLVSVLDRASGSKVTGALLLIPRVGGSFDAPNANIDLRRKNTRTLRRVRTAHIVLPHPYILEDNIPNEGDVAFASGGFPDV